LRFINELQLRIKEEEVVLYLLINKNAKSKIENAGLN
jgi:hypothetical protein